MTNAVPITLAAARAYLEQLDLDYIVDAMCSPSYALPRWNKADAIHCCHLYKNFLYLQKKHFNVMLVPSKQIDEFWHNHILYTKKYFHDCMQIFGGYYHHEPATPADNKQELVDNYLKTKQFYQDEFGVSLALIDRSALLT